MSNSFIVSPFGRLAGRFRPTPALDLHHWSLDPDRLPYPVRASPEAIRCLSLLGPLAWDGFPERDLQRNHGQASTPYAAWLLPACSSLS
jgi:hypothetical protein